MKEELVSHLTSPVWWFSATVGTFLQAVGALPALWEFLGATAGLWFGAGSAFFGIAAPELGMPQEIATTALIVIAMGFATIKLWSLGGRFRRRFDIV